MKKGIPKSFEFHPPPEVWELPNKKIKKAQIKLLRGLLDLIILQLLRSQPMHSYRIIMQIRKNFGIYFGSSTIYPLMNRMEEEGYIKSEWKMEGGRYRKVYNLTSEGQDFLTLTEDLVKRISQKIVKEEKDKYSDSDNLKDW
jgi:DNA-binding PadR family transcriptional regulator